MQEIKSNFRVTYKIPGLRLFGFTTNCQRHVQICMHESIYLAREKIQRHKNASGTLESKI